MLNSTCKNRFDWFYFKHFIDDCRSPKFMLMSSDRCFKQHQNIGADLRSGFNQIEVVYIRIRSYHNLKGQVEV